MHELNLTQSIVEAVLDAAGERRIVRLWLEIGRLSGVVPDAVRFCFDLAAAGTALEAAELDIDEPAGRGECRDCEVEFEVDTPIVLCACGSADVAVLAGRELRIRAVEVE